jgi:hypothetical protein
MLANEYREFLASKPSIDGRRTHHLSSEVLKIRRYGPYMFQLVRHTKKAPDGTMWVSKSIGIFRRDICETATIRLAHVYNIKQGE